MKKVITYGTYDLLHQGHINLLRRAKELGDYLIVGVTNDNFDRERGKLNVCNNVLERVEAVKATGFADQIIIEDYFGQKIDDIQKYDVDIFAIGSDWEGKFDYLNEFCKVVYLPRTEGISSTMLRNEKHKTIRVGIVGCGGIANSHMNVYKQLPDVEVVAGCDLVPGKAAAFFKEYGLTDVKTDYPSHKEMLDDESLALDAVSVCTYNCQHMAPTIQAMQKGIHVLLEKPFTVTLDEAVEVMKVEKETGAILSIGFQPRFDPNMQQVKKIVESGVLGQIYYIQTGGGRRRGIPARAGKTSFILKETAGLGALADIPWACQREEQCRRTSYGEKQDRKEKQQGCREKKCADRG